MDRKTEKLLSMRKIVSESGQSIIKHPPLFSLDGKLLFIIRKRTVCVYNTETGKFVRDLTKINGNLVNIQNNPLEPSLLFGCTVDGDFISWIYDSGKIKNVVKIGIPSLSIQVVTFHIVPYKKKHFGLVTWNAETRSFLIGMFDLTNGCKQNTMLDSNLPETHHFNNDLHKVAVSKNHQLNTIAIIQNPPKLLVANYDTGEKQRLGIPSQEKLTVVACNAEKEVVAIGNIKGNIFIYYNIYSEKNPVVLLVDRHFHPVGSIAFSASGCYMYSGCAEKILIEWNYRIDEITKSNFLADITGAILHIAVSGNNRRIAVSKDDNEIMLTNPLNVLPPK